jgi:hypothetical protein
MAEQTKCIACKEGSREAVFSWGDEFTYVGRTSDDHTWNGWNVPAFTYGQVRLMMEETKGVKGYGQISELEGKGFRVDSNDDPDTSDGWTVVVPPTKCCGMYFIGDGWTWEEVEPEVMCRECGKPADCSCGVSSHL